MSYNYSSKQSYTYYQRQPAITISNPNQPQYNRYQNNYYGKQKQNFQWTKAQEDELRNLVESYKDQINWQQVSYKLGRPINNVQNKYTHLTEPEWTDSESKFILEYWKKICEEKQELNLEDLTQKLNDECSCKHTLKGIQLQLERITERNKQLQKYKIHKDFVDSGLKQKIRELSEQINEILERCQRSETYDFVVGDIQEKCKQLENVIQQQKEKEALKQQEAKQEQKQENKNEKEEPKNEEVKESEIKEENNEKQEDNKQEEK